MTRRRSQEVVLIGLDEAEAYLAAGWQVKPLGRHHGFYSLLAWRWC